jgi:hypothetical protein
MLRVLAILFLFSLFIPAEFYTMVGTVRIEAYRIILAVALVYALFNFKVLIPRADLVDVLLIALVMLAFASFWHNHGLQKAIESTGLFALETLGAFYLARMYVITPARFFKVNQFMIIGITLLIGFTIYEAFTHDRILHRWAEMITGKTALDYRLYTEDYLRGPIMRATSVFVHPLLFGTLAALLFPFAVLLAVRTIRPVYLFNAFSLVVSMILTMSSAPLLSVIFHGATAVLVKFWHGARQFWVALFLGFIAIAMLINAFSNRGFFGILISYLTFNPNTGYFRMLQWQYTLDDDIPENLILGIAYNDWTRPYWMEWMGNSIDSYWLLLVLQHGIFAGLVLLIACFYAVFNMLNQVHQHDDTSRWMVTAWILSFMSLILIGFTVDYFGTLQPIMFFMLGAISWAKFYRSWDSDHPTENLVTHEIRANNTVITSNNLQD